MSSFLDFLPLAGVGGAGFHGCQDALDLQGVGEGGFRLAAFADGCVTAACVGGADKNGDGLIDGNDNDGTARATIIRQSGGKTLFAAYD